VIPKIIDLDERFATGEPTLFVVARSEKGRWYTEKAASYREKTASPAFDYIKGVAPKEGHTIILVNALGAFETYDDNRNGDAFPARPYMVGKRATCGHPKCAEALDGWINPSEVVTAHYKTFEKFGKVFKHHVNKEPLKAYGDVMQAFWNDRMQRVELLLDIVNAKDPETIAQINDGLFPAVSMGCHVRWDVCAVCGHRAPTRKDYCEHLDLAMRRIDPLTGRRHCALNPSPRFFDISIVRRPADPTGYMLKKVAEQAYEPRSSWDAGEKIAAFEAKQAAIRKISDIQKVLVGDVLAGRTTPDLELFRKYRKEVLPAASAAFEPASDAHLLSMAEYDLPTVTSTLASKNAALTCDELTRLCFLTAKVAYHRAHGLRVVAAQPFVREVLAQYPGLHAKAAAAVACDARRVSPALLARLGDWVEKRATLGEWLRQQVHNSGLPLVGRGASVGPGYAYGAREPAKTDVMTMTDSGSGEVYRTTRGAAQAAADANYRSLLGRTALVNGAYTLGLGLPTAAALPAAYATARGAHKFLHPYHGTQYQTDQGPVLAGNTEFVKSSALAVSNTTLLNKLALDYGGVPDAAVLRGIAATSPTGAKLAAALDDATSLRTKVALLFSCDEHGDDATAPASVEFDRAADKLGALLVV
jgi:hypothetical protein